MAATGVAEKPLLADHVPVSAQAMSATPSVRAVIRLRTTSTGEVPTSPKRMRSIGAAAPSDITTGTAASGASVNLWRQATLRTHDRQRQRAAVGRTEIA